MKKIVLVLCVMLSVLVVDVNAQAFKAKNFNIDFGYVINSHRGGYAFYSPGFMVSFEKGVHKWIGVGAYGGFQYNVGTTIWGWGGTRDRVSVPFGGTGSFHFYQMISDLVGKEIGSDKLDLAIKHSFGARLDFDDPLVVRFDWGTSLNARYFFTDNFGVYLEAGYPAMGNLIIGGAVKF